MDESSYWPEPVKVEESPATAVVRPEKSGKQEPATTKTEEKDLLDVERLGHTDNWKNLLKFLPAAIKLTDETKKELEEKNYVKLEVGGVKAQLTLRLKKDNSGDNSAVFVVGDKTEPLSTMVVGGLVDQTKLPPTGYEDDKSFLPPGKSKEAESFTRNMDLTVKYSQMAITVTQDTRGDAVTYMVDGGWKGMTHDSKGRDIVNNKSTEENLASKYKYFQKGFVRVFKRIN